MSQPPVARTSTPEPKRHRPDKLAVLCAERPLLFILVRLLATLSILILLTFVADATMFALAVLASNRFSAILINGDFLSDEDRLLLISTGEGLPFKWIRLLLLAFTVAALFLTELRATRGLPSGEEAMRLSILHGLPWPGRWQSSVRIARRVQPWVICLAGAGVIFVLVGWPRSVIDLLLTPVLVGGAAGLVRLLGYLGVAGGRILTDALPSHVDLTTDALLEAARAVEEADDAVSRQLWPKHEPLRVHAAARVFNSPPPPMRRSERRRAAWWTDKETSIESLATELVLNALLEARAGGFLILCDVQRRNPRVVASLPKSGQPVGLAALVVGHHREGGIIGRAVAGRLSDLLKPVYSVDPHARVLDMALEDLASAEIALFENGAWKLSRELLSSVASSTRSNDATGANPELSRRDALRLRRNIARLLRRKRTSEVPLESPLQILLSPAVLASELRERHRYQLPGRLD